MENVNKTLYIPLRGKAYVSSQGIILHDPKAEEIWAAEAFRLKGKSKSKWLAYYMGMRAAVFDRWLKRQMEADPSAVILYIGCGMDSRCERVGVQGHRWYDIDFADIRNHAGAIERRLDDSGLDPESLIRENERNLALCRQHGYDHVLIDDKYDINI